MPTLRDRLAELAEKAPAPSAYPDLWERGVARARRRTAVTAAVGAACLLLLVTGIGTVWRTLGPVEAAPADGAGPTYLPDRFFEPSPWLEGTAEAGPVGPLIAVIQADRKTWTTTNPGVVGVSAVTGEYRFLDLPDASSRSEFALSPDGRHVAYWITGETTDAPFLHTKGDERGTEPDPQSAVVGYAVYDTVSGKVVARETFDSEHGLAVDRAPVWGDDDTLAFEFGHYIAGDPDHPDYGASMGRELWVRDLEQSAARRVPRDSVEPDLSGSNAQGWFTFGDGINILTISRLEPGAQFRTLTTAGEEAYPLFVSPDGVSLAGDRMVTEGPIESYQKGLVIGAIGRGGPVRLAQIPSPLALGQTLGWRDAQHLLVAGRLKEIDERLKLFAVNVKSGRAEPLASLDAGPSLAMGLVDSPVTEADEPPTPLNPWVRLGLGLVGVGAALAGLVALVRWRRRG